MYGHQKICIMLHRPPQEKRVLKWSKFSWGLRVVKMPRCQRKKQCKNKRRSCLCTNGGFDCIYYGFFSLRHMKTPLTEARRSWTLQIYGRLSKLYLQPDLDLDLWTSKVHGFELLFCSRFLPQRSIG